MNRASLAFALSAVVLICPAVSRAADPAGQENSDPFAPDAKAPSTEDEEAAVLGTPAKPAPPPPPVAAPRRAAATQQADDAEGRSSKKAAKQETVSDQSGVAIELSTSGFASGALDAGLFIGGRTASGTIIGGLFDYSLTSLTLTNPGGPDVAQSLQSFRLGAGVRQPFLQTADKRAELYGAADVTFDYRSAEVPSTSGSKPTDSLSAAGFSLALGPGVRLWVHDQVSIGYAARFRLSFLSGQAGALSGVPSDETIDGKLTTIGFDGVFQILAVF